MTMIVAGDVYQHALFLVLLLLRQRFRLVRDLAAFHDPLSARPLIVGAHGFRMGTGLRIVVLNIDIGGHKGLPKSVEIGFAVRGARRFMTAEIGQAWGASPQARWWWQLLRLPRTALDPRRACSQ